MGASTAVAGIADLAAYEGRYSEAIRILQQGADSDLTAHMSDNAARRLVSLAELEVERGQKSAATAATEKALSLSQAMQIRFLAARIYVEVGEAKALKLANGLSSELAAEPQAYGKIIAGMVAAKRGDSQLAIKSITEANTLLDTWIGRFELGRAYLTAAAFAEADSEFERCANRRGEAIELFLDNVPTYAYFPRVYYYQGRVRQEMKSTGFADFFRAYIGVRGQSGEDPLLREIRQRPGQ